jgi:membrane protease YdiL (CAAX protease family)
MDKYSATPADRIRTIAAVGELKGAEPALKRIEQEETKAPEDAIKEDLAALRTIYDGGPEGLDADARQRLIDRHGFFGRLAVSYGARSDDPIRKTVIAEGQRATVVAIVLVVGMVALAIVVLAAVITAIVLAALGKFRRGYLPNPLVNSAFLEAFALSLVLLIGVSLIMRLIKANSLAWEWVMLLLIPIMMMWIRMRGVASPEDRRGLGWYRGRGLLVEMACGLFGYFAGIPIIVAGIFISLKLSKYAGASPMHPIQKMLQGNAWQILNLYIAACVIAPVLEETMFRGSLFNHMRRRWGWFISAFLVAFIFAAIHPQGWTLIPGLGSIAVVLAAIREWRGSLWGSIMAHAANNGIVLTLALMVAR